MTNTHDTAVASKALSAWGKRTLEASARCVAKIDEIQTRRAALEAEMQADIANPPTYLTRAGAVDRIANYAKRGEAIAVELEEALEELRQASAP